MNVPIMMPRVLAALCSLFILIKCLSFVGVWSWSTSCSVKVFDEPEPLSASPATIKTKSVNLKSKTKQHRTKDMRKCKSTAVCLRATLNYGGHRKKSKATYWGVQKSPFIWTSWNSRLRWPFVLACCRSTGRRIVCFGIGSAFLTP